MIELFFAKLITQRERLKTKMLQIKLLYMKAENFLLELKVKRLEKQIKNRKPVKHLL